MFTFTTSTFIVQTIQFLFYIILNVVVQNCDIILGKYES